MSDQDTTHDAPSHDIGTGKGEEKSQNEGKEAGREDTGTSGAGRPQGKSTARDSTGINPESENPIDPASPRLPPS